MFGFRTRQTVRGAGPKPNGTLSSFPRMGRGCALRLEGRAPARLGLLPAWLKYVKGIDALLPSGARLPADGLLYQDLRGLAQGGLIRWTKHRSVGTAQGHKHRRVVEVRAPEGGSGGLASWEGFTE